MSGDATHVPGDRAEIPPPVPGRVVVLGVSAAGKSTLVARLRALGYDARACSQEHSYVPNMWQRLSRPQALIYLDANLEAVLRRRPTTLSERDLEVEHGRLAHARQHCDVYIDTTSLSADEVCQHATQALVEMGISSVSAPRES